MAAVTTRRDGLVATLPKAPAWTFPGRYDSTPKDPGPGPGEYHGMNISFGQKGVGFGTSTRCPAAPSSTATPSPIDYQPRIDPVRSSHPAYTFGGKAVPEHLKSKTPGPGHYDAVKATNVVRPSSSAYSIAHRCAPDRASERKPGPDAYNVAKFQPKEPHGATLKFRNDRPRADSAAPGPGAYDLGRHRTVGKTFGASRHYLRPDNGVPGPGYYAPTDGAATARRAI